MKKAYLYLSVLMVIVAASLLILPERDRDKQLAPDKLLAEITDPSRYLTTDEVAGMIISGDPGLLLIDTRDQEQYDRYHLPGAIRMPVTQVADQNMREILEQPGKQIVFYSNGDILAEQAWIISKRMGINHAFVMKDGLNRWMETVIRPVMPAETAASEEFDLYQFRRGASMYFGGDAGEVKTATTTTEPIIFQKKEKKAAAEGGC